MRKILFIAIILSYSTFHLSLCHADSLDVKLRVGYNIGGTAPMGLPASIRSIDAFQMTPSLMVGGDVNLTLRKHWKLSAGLHFENKGMDTEVTTKSYRMEMRKGNSQISGFFTGHVKQVVSQWMVTLPVQTTYQLNEHVTLKAGPYVSLLVHKDFSGIAFDGYLRQGDPTGPKIIIGNTEADWATYDFSEEMRSLQWGVSVGIDWHWDYRLGLSADLNWGLSGIFSEDFKTVEQPLYPIYGSVGVFYKL